MTLFVNFIHKKWHLNSYHSDTKHHMTQNIMCSVARAIYSSYCSLVYNSKIYMCTVGMRLEPVHAVGVRRNYIIYICMMHRHHESSVHFTFKPQVMTTYLNSLALNEFIRKYLVRTT